MDEKEDLIVIFTDRADNVFADILKSHGLEESDEEFLNDVMDLKESRRTIIRNAAITLAKKIIPEKKIIELLQKYLELPKESVEKIIRDVKNKLLPLLLVYPDEKFNDPVFREEISKKVFGEEKETPLPYIIKPEIVNVEESARILKKKRETTVQEKTTGKELQRRETLDRYRESID